MPITLEKLFSDTLTVSFPYLGETVNVTWAPARYTGEMQELADRLVAEMTADQGEITDLRERAAAALAEADRLVADGLDDEDDEVTTLRAEADALVGEADVKRATLSLKDRRALRENLVRFLVAWDVLDGATPLPIDLPALNRLPDDFLRTIWLNLLAENKPDPQKAPSSDAPSSTAKGSAPSPTGIRSSSRRARSGSARSSSTSGRSALAAIPSGAPGR